MCLICHQLQTGLLQLTISYILHKFGNVGKAALAKVAVKIQSKETKGHLIVKAENHDIPKAVCFV